MKTIYTPNGDRYTCPRMNHDHNQNGRNVPCMACRREPSVTEMNQGRDALR